MAEALAEFVFGYELAWRSSGRKGTYTEPPVIARARAVLDAAGWRWS
jgi:hypothetical protein